MTPYVEPDPKPGEPPLDPTGRRAPEPDVRYVTASEATPEDRMTAWDHMAVMAGIGCAQLVRLLIILVAIGIVFGGLYLVTHH